MHLMQCACTVTFGRVTEMPGWDSFVELPSVVGFDESLYPREAANKAWEIVEYFGEV